MMKKQAKEQRCEMHTCCKPGARCDSGSMVYGLGFLGALVYYLQTTVGFWPGALGVLKAIVWPAFLVHALLTLVGA